MEIVLWKSDFHIHISLGVEVDAEAGVVVLEDLGGSAGVVVNADIVDETLYGY